MEPVRLSTVRVDNNPIKQMSTTLRMMGEAIQEGAKYLPIRNHAAEAATRAGPKDYLGQIRNIYNQFVTRDWRYVKDPFGNELIHKSPNAIYNLVIGGGKGNPGLGSGRGGGDCDDASIALGSLLRSIGFPVRLGVTAPPGFPAGPEFTHVFIQASVPGLGWLTVDPVPYPRRGLGYTPVHSRIAFFDLNGRMLGYKGNARGLKGLLGEEEIAMNNYGLPDLTEVPDYGLAGIEDADQTMPLDWRKYVLKDFGIYSDKIGFMSGEGLGLAAEVEYWQEPGGQIIARTPMLEISPDDYAHMRRYRRPYHGMMALGDEGQAYEYDGFSGFFKKLFRKAKKLVKRVGQKIGRGIKKVIKKIPGGKYLVKLGQKIKKVALKFTKPLIKFVGKYAAKLAPVAALIPGYGPAIAAGLHTAGKIANIMRKHGAKIIGKKGKTRNIKFPSGKSAKAFRAELKKAAEAQKRKSRGKKRRKISTRARRAPARARGMRALRSFKRRPPLRRMRPAMAR